MTTRKRDRVDLSEFSFDNTQIGCKFRHIWHLLTPEQRAKLAVVLPSDSRVTHPSIARVLNGWSAEGGWSLPGAGFFPMRFDTTNVGRHRRGECQCEVRW